MKKNIVIIGAGGFIGSHITKRFSNSNCVIPIYRGTLNLLDHREVHDFLKGVNADVVINAYSAGGKDRVNDTDLDIVSANLIIFDNFRKSKHLFKRYINIGSGAEFNKDGVCHEEDILSSIPTTSYGLSKNLIARMCLQEENFYTLRLFGCFGNDEPSFRLYTKYMLNSGAFIVDDKYFDNISIKDFLCIMTDYVIRDPLHKDVNCVYTDKLLISRQLEMLGDLTGYVRPIKIVSRGKDYIGSSSRIKSMGLPLAGIELGMETYKWVK